MSTIESTLPVFNPEAIAHAKRICNWTFGGLTVVLALSGAEPQAVLTGVSWILVNRALSLKTAVNTTAFKKRNPIKSAAVLTGVAAFLLTALVLKLGPIIGLLAAFGAGVGMRKLLLSDVFRAGTLSQLSPPPAPPKGTSVPPELVIVAAVPANGEATVAAAVEPAIIVAARAEIERLLAAAGKLKEVEMLRQLTGVADSLNQTLNAIAQDEEKTASARTLLSVHLPAAADLTEDFAKAPKSARTKELRERYKQLIGSLSERADSLHERFVGREARKLDVKMEVLKKRLEEDY